MPSQTFDKQMKTGFKRMDNTELVLQSISCYPIIRVHQVAALSLQHHPLQNSQATAIPLIHPLNKAQEAS